MTNQERAKEFLDYIHYEFGDTELNIDFLKVYFEDEDNIKEYNELIYMAIKFLFESGDIAICDSNYLKEKVPEAHNIATSILIVILDLIDSNFKFIPTKEASWNNDLQICTKISTKVREDPEYKLTPSEALKIIEFFKGIKCLDSAKSDAPFNFDLRHNLNIKGAKTYLKALETLNEMIKIDGYTIETLDDNTKSVNGNTKTDKIYKTIEREECVIIINKSSFIQCNFETSIRFNRNELEDLNHAFSEINEAFYEPKNSKVIVNLMDNFLSKLKDHYPDNSLIQEINFNDYQIIFCGYNTVSHDHGIQFLNNKYSIIVRD
jgi:hypothetical protein